MKYKIKHSDVMKYKIIAVLLILSASLISAANVTTSLTTLTTTILTTTTSTSSTTTILPPTLPTCNVNMNNINYTDNNIDRIPVALVVKNGHTNVGFTNKTHYFVNFTLNCNNPSNLLINLTDSKVPVYQSSNSTITKSFSYNESVFNSTYGFNLTTKINGVTVVLDPFTPPAKINSYLNLTLSSSANNYQLIFTYNALKYKAYESDNLNNIELFYKNGTLGNSWMEGSLSNEIRTTGLNSLTDIVYVVKLNPSASGTVNVISLGFNSSFVNLFDGVTVGEAPQLSGTYAQYDNGASVFITYQNFAGASVPTGWSCAGAYTIANGMSVTDTDCVSTASYSAGNTVDAYGYVTGSGGAAVIGYTSSDATTNQFAWGHYASNVGGCSVTTLVIQPVTSAASTTVCGSSVSGLSGASNVLTTAWDSSTTGTWFSNYVSDGTVTSSGAVSNIHIGSAMNGARGTNFVQWIRQRYSPPSDVMPTVTFNGNITQQPITTTTSVFTTSSTISYANSIPNEANVWLSFFYNVPLGIYIVLFFIFALALVTTHSITVGLLADSVVGISLLYWFPQILGVVILIGGVAAIVVIAEFIIARYNRNRNTPIQRY